MRDHIARMRRTGSLCLPGVAVVRGLIGATQRGRFGPLVTPQTFELGRNGGELASGRRELEDGEALFRRYRGKLEPEDLAGLRILDLGCGYGGRTIYYATVCGAEHVHGIEVSEQMVERCKRLADDVRVGNVSFAVEFAEALASGSETFDAVISFDVLEHVGDPEAALSEIARVLRPGGRAWLVFPSYLGARSAHLDYVTRLPALHRIFDPTVLVSAVNDVLERDPERYGTPPQPPPHDSALGRTVLPTLNGLTLRDSRRLLAKAGLETELEVVTPLVEPESELPLGSATSRALSRWHARRTLPELLVSAVAVTVRKPA